MTKYETVIGLEVHAQLYTRSKMFCSCAADYQRAQPNTRVCPVCLGLPGSLPVINEKAVRGVVMTGLALHSRVLNYTKFDRKNYPYPDLMKGYQISQFDMPICMGGYMDIEVGSVPKKIGIERVHLEEDVAKLFHRFDPSTGEPYTLIDVNRSGVPLMEMVSNPDMRSPDEAREYLVKLRSILRFLGVSTGNMEEGSFRCDANVSVRLYGADAFGTKVEVKNMNSFRSVQRALEFEVQRQTTLLDAGGQVRQETRGWNQDRGVTVSMRSKEHSHDYRFFPEPDLPPLTIDPGWIEAISADMPELAEDKRYRFIQVYGISDYDARQLTGSPEIAFFYEEVLQEFNGAYSDSSIAKTAANWIITELSRLLNDHGLPLDESLVTPAHLVGLISLLQSGTIGTPQAKIAFEEMFKSGKSAYVVVEELALKQITDSGAIVDAVRDAIESNPKAVQDYLGGKETSSKFLVGQVMKLTKGRANPLLVAELVAAELERHR
jgi:aspartyl-tRNA(Asn)/glutamyl-tRNA(Gln) amidotransferase subunit B